MTLSFYNYDIMAREIPFRFVPLCTGFHSFMLSYAYLVHCNIHVHFTLQTGILMIWGLTTSFKQYCCFKIMTKFQFLREMHVHDENIILIKL